jgi:hypothetical protein
VKHRELPTFLSDFKKLSRDERSAFIRVLRESFIPACDAYSQEPASYVWPKALRVERITNSNGVWAFTWSFSGPDGRATFNFDTVDRELILVWRRVGRHSIYGDP